MNLMRLIDDATSRMLLRFVEHDATEANLDVLGIWLRRYGRIGSYYTDKTSLFQNAENRRRDQPGEEMEARQMAPAQMGRALRELQISWIAAHWPQAQGRGERDFGTDQDRLVKGLRVAGVATIEAANEYLESDCLPWREKACMVLAADADDAQRRLGPEHDIESILSHVEWRNGEVAIAFQCKFPASRQDSSPVKTALPAPKPTMARKAPGAANSLWRQGYKNLKLKASSKTSAPEFYRVANRKVLRSISGRFGGLAPTASGANSFASALYRQPRCAPGDRQPRIGTAFLAARSEQDISIWR